MSNRRELIKHAIKQRARMEDNWYDVQEHRTLQLFYTFKAIVCILLNREVGGVNPHIELLDCVSIADWNFQSAFYWDYGDGATWDSLYVGYGLFSNWRYFTIGDGYP